MKPNASSFHCLALTALFLFRSSSLILAQGPLTPPGTPAPTMKTLDQVEARTPISSAPFMVTTSGSYYLTGNLTVAGGGAITISADHVTLDLNGFTIASTASPAAGNAITLDGTRRNVVIKNGQIRGTTTFAASSFKGGGFVNGITNTTLGSNLRVSEITVFGLEGDGINLASNTAASFVVERCTVSNCGDAGIRAGTIRDCVADTTGGTAISGDSVINCTGETVSIVGSAIGVSGLSVVQNCIGISVTGTGIQGQQMSNSFGTSSSGNGLNATNALNCQGVTTSGTNGINIASGGTATFCRGRRDGGVAINAANGSAIGCGVLSTGTVVAAHKSLGTP